MFSRVPCCEGLSGVTRNRASTTRRLPGSFSWPGIRPRYFLSAESLQTRITRQSLMVTPATMKIFVHPCRSRSSAPSRSSIADNAIVNGDLHRARAALRDLHDAVAASTAETKSHDGPSAARRR